MSLSVATFSNEMAGSCPMFLKKKRERAKDKMIWVFAQEIKTFYNNEDYDLKYHNILFLSQVNFVNLETDNKTRITKPRNSLEVDICSNRRLH